MAWPLIKHKDNFTFTEERDGVVGRQWEMSIAEGGCIHRRCATLDEISYRKMFLFGILGPTFVNTLEGCFGPDISNRNISIHVSVKTSINQLTRQSFHLEIYRHKVKLQLFLYLTKHHAMKVYCEWR
jgi:hypothetical protein